jgi:hypothetical protein
MCDEVVPIATNLESLFIALLSPNKTVFVLCSVDMKRVQGVGYVATPAPDPSTRCPGSS